jgi:hypothetical protein
VGDNPLYLLTLVVVALIALAAGMLVERYRRQDDRRGIASAFAGEISGILKNAETRKLPAYFRALAPLLKSSTPPPPPWLFFDTTYEQAPVAKAYIDRVGMLGPRLAGRVVEFYHLYSAVILEVKILAAGVYNGDPLKAAGHIERTLDLWNEVQPLMRPLIAELFSVSGEQP